MLFADSIVGRSDAILVRGVLGRAVSPASSMAGLSESKRRPLTVELIEFTTDAAYFRYLVEVKGKFLQLVEDI